MASELREAVQSTDWETLYTEGKTKFRVEPAWCASEERCEVLRRLCKKYKATRVLEVGAFCGIGSISMAECLPEDGQVIALEIDPFLKDFGQPYRDKSEHGKKISYLIGPAMDSLRTIARGCMEGMILPFDFLMIDADRAGMMEYFNMFWWESPGMLAEQATVCIDITPYKGQSPVLARGPSVGELQGDLWIVPSGQDQIDTLRRTLEASKDHKVYQVAGLIVSHAKNKQADAASESQVSTPKRTHVGGEWKGKSPGQSPCFSPGANPLASFPNDRAIRAVGGPNWVSPTVSNPVAELREEVRRTDWGALYAEGKTLTRVEADWCGSDERCALLRCLLASSNATNVLEVGGFCGMSGLSMAEELADDGLVTSLEIDPFLVSFGQKIVNKCAVGKKIRSVVGPAMDSIEAIKREATQPTFKPFDFVVIDADRENMSDYFHSIFEAPGFLTETSTICVDVRPYKGQMPIAAHQAGQWVLPSGLDKVDALIKTLEASARCSVHRVSGLLIVKSTGMSELTL